MCPQSDSALTHKQRAGKGRKRHRNGEQAQPYAATRRAIRAGGRHHPWLNLCEPVPAELLRANLLSKQMTYSLDPLEMRRLGLTGLQATSSTLNHHS